MASDLRQLLKRAQREGWTVTLTNGNHYRLKHATGPIVFASFTPSDHHALRNIEADLRRALRRGGNRC